MNKIWTTDVSIDADFVYEYTEVWEPTMQIAWEENEEGDTELVQLYLSKNGEEKWLPLQTL